MDYSIWDILFLIIGAICQQDVTSIATNMIIRVITFLSFLSYMLLFTLYAANLVALLESSSDDIKNVEDLLMSHLSVGVHDTPFNYIHFSVRTL